MSLTYATWVAQLANLMVQDPTDPNFQTFLPGCIDYAEQRLYRELDLQASRIIDNSTTFTALNRYYTLPTLSSSLYVGGSFIVVEQVSAVTPATATSSTGTLNPLVPVTKEFIDYTWPSNSSSIAGVPQFFAPINNTTFSVAPPPDSAYAVQVVGTVRPAPLSSTNTTTFLTIYLPDLFMAASMIFATSYQRDFGATTDNPASSVTWEGEYQRLIQSANVEELRKRFMSQAWTSMTPSPIATPPRV